MLTGTLVRAGATALAIAALHFVLRPEGPWEADETLFAAGVLDLDLAAHSPHPPGFPGLLVLGRLVMPLTGDPVIALQLVGALSTGVAAVCLLHLSARWAGATAGALATLLWWSAPLTWFHAARALSDGPAIALALLAAVLISALFDAEGSARAPSGRADEPRRAAADATPIGDPPHRSAQGLARRDAHGWSLALGAWLSLAAAATVRAQLTPTLCVLAIALVIVQRRAGLGRSLPLGICVAAATCAAGYGWIIADTGGLGRTLAVARAHVGEHSRVVLAAAQVDRSWYDSIGLLRGFGGPVGMAVAALNAVAALVGLALAVRSTPRLAMVSGCALAVTMTSVLVLHHPAFPRYSVAILAAWTLPVAVALAALPRTVAIPLTVVTSAWMLVCGLPSVWWQHSHPLPPTLAMRVTADAIARGHASEAVVSRGVGSFARIFARQAPGQFPFRLANRGALPLSTRPAMIAGSFLTLPGLQVCEQSLGDLPEGVSALGQRRFDHVTVAEGAVLLGEGVHNLEHAPDGRRFVWLSNHAHLGLPAGDRAVVTLTITSGLAPQRMRGTLWRGGVVVASVDPRVLESGRQRISIDLSACERQPCELELEWPDARAQGRDRRLLSARLEDISVVGGVQRVSTRWLSPAVPDDVEAAMLTIEGIHRPGRFGERPGVWTKGEVHVRGPAEPGVVVLELARPAHLQGPVVARLEGAQYTLAVAATPRLFVLPVRAEGGAMDLALSSASFIPSARNPDSRDGRELALAWTRLALIPEAPCGRLRLTDLVIAGMSGRGALR